MAFSTWFFTILKPTTKAQLCYGQHSFRASWSCLQSAPSPTRTRDKHRRTHTHKPNKRRAPNQGSPQNKTPTHMFPRLAHHGVLVARGGAAVHVPGRSLSPLAQFLQPLKQGGSTQNRGGMTPLLRGMEAPGCSKQKVGPLGP